MHLNPLMAQDNRQRKTEDSDPARQDTPDPGRSPYGDHPFLGNDRQPFTKDFTKALLRFPERPTRRSYHSPAVGPGTRCCAQGI